MDEFSQLPPVLLLIGTAVAAVLTGALVFWFFRRPRTALKVKQKAPGQQTKKKTKKEVKKSQREPSQTTAEPLLYQQLKVHSDDVGSVCWHPSGEYLITTSRDRALRIFPTATLLQSAR